MYNQYRLALEHIHNDADQAIGDVAFRLLESETFPTMAYSICINKGIGYIYTRLLDKYNTYFWENISSVGKCISVAIEFNGIWKVNPQTNKYNLVTEELPYLFWVTEDHKLYFQKLFGEEIRLLAEDVIQVTACRGWQSADRLDIDQGLVVGYIKSDGSVYYRSLCMQVNGQNLFEDERNVSELGTGNSYISIYKLNDYRLGFLVENNGDIITAVTTRTYVGQTLEPGQLKADITNIVFEYREPSTNNYQQEHGIISAGIGTIYLAVYAATSPYISLVSAERLSTTQIKIILSHELYGTIDNSTFVIASPISPVRNITNTVYNSSEKSVTITLDNPIQYNTAITINMPVSYARYYYIEPNSRCPIDTQLSINIERVITNSYAYSDHGYVSAGISAYSFEYEPCTYHENNSDNGTITVSISRTFSFSPVSGNPI